MKTTALFAAILALAAAGAHAQNIERVKMTDNDLSCRQIYQEIGVMNGAIASASQPVAVATAPVAPVDNSAIVGAGVAGAVAQTALARSGGFGGFGGFGGGLGNLGGMFGGIAQQAMNSQAQQQQANAQAAAQQAQMQAQQSTLMGQQALGRKDHLTGLFLSKGCKLSEVQ
ncbi:MAG: hypothetical protein H7332_08375 [Bdellovibrionales bacterium]|nr:hypothetical protein [Ramlibacter sp.]